MTEDNLLALSSGYELNHYIIDSVLGQGGFGIVYKAHHKNFDDAVVIKEYLPSSMASRSGNTVVPHTSQSKDQFIDSYQRFMDEGRTLNRLEHKNIVKCSDLFEANGTAYLVMKFEDGLPFHDLLTSLEEKGSQYSEAQLLQVFLPLAKGLSYIHNNGVLHRDIKPGNVFIRRSDNSPVLLDFGAAKQNFAEVSQSVSPYTEFYAPIDQIDTSQKPTQSIDIHAFGGLMYRAVTGTIGPYATERSLKLARRQPDPLSSASDLAGEFYSAELLALIDHCLAFSPEDRPASMQEVVSVLEKLQGIESGEVETVNSNTEQFNSMIEMAGSDQVITEQEMQFLLTKAVTYGIDEASALQMITSQSIKNGWEIQQNDSVKQPPLNKKSKAKPRPKKTVKTKKAISLKEYIKNNGSLSPQETRKVIKDLTDELKAKNNLNYRTLCIDASTVCVAVDSGKYYFDNKAFLKDLPKLALKDIYDYSFAPEVRQGQHIDQKSAIYSLAAIAHFCLTGNRIFTHLRKSTAKFKPRSILQLESDNEFLKAICWGLALKKADRPNNLRAWVTSWDEGVPLSVKELISANSGSKKKSKTPHKTLSQTERQQPSPQTKSNNKEQAQQPSNQEADTIYYERGFLDYLDTCLGSLWLALGYLIGWSILWALGGGLIAAIFEITLEDSTHTYVIATIAVISYITALIEESKKLKNKKKSERYDGIAGSFALAVIIGLIVYFFS